ncbi:hypothetical protein SLEP1_g43194 [Rubroshorea leprosula]|uniref:Uncharacterized protein n=1 Tax=Rubroshorea leprosula TaxID=152421 RepID=A0AAV5LCY4_9ROSI|nr:hypothetical protein SLEP1_g43194 [Rubroshorea leprosula]
MKVILVTWCTHILQGFLKEFLVSMGDLLYRCSAI